MPTAIDIIASGEEEEETLITTVNKEKVGGDMTETKSSWFASAGIGCSLATVVLTANYYGIATLGPSVLFSYHPLFMSIFVASTISAIMALMIGEKVVSNKKSSYRRFHWWTQGCGLVCGLLGFSAIYVNKDRMGKDHITSWHSITGLASLALCIIVGGFGFFVKVLLPKGDQFARFRGQIRSLFWLHRVVGFITALTMLLCVGLAFDSLWAQAVMPVSLRYSSMGLLIATACIGIYVKLERFLVAGIIKSE